MTKRKKSTKDPHHKMFPASCGHKPDKYLKHKDVKNLKTTQSKCSEVARTGCKICILHYMYTVYKKEPYYINRAKKFVSECVCYGAEQDGRSIDEVFELLQLCHFAGLGFAFEIFSFEDRYTKQQLIWLFDHGASPLCMSLTRLIKNEKWETILLVAHQSTCQPIWSDTNEAINCLTNYLFSSLLSIVLLHFIND